MGDLAATFEAFYRREFPRLAGSLRLVCGDEGLAEELTQEAFARALNHWDRIHDYDKPEGWLFRTGFNLLRRHWKRRKFTETATLIEPAHIDAEPDGGDMLRLLSTLPMTQRQAVVLRHLLDYSTDDAADMLEMTPGALRMTLNRAMTNLRGRMPNE